MGMENPPAPNDSDRPFWIEAGLCLAIIFSAVAFGAMPVWASAALSALLSFLLFCRPQAAGGFFLLPVFFRRGILAVFVFLCFQTAAVSRTPYFTGQEIFKWASLGAAFLLAMQLPGRCAFRLTAVLLATGVAEVVYGIYQVAGGSEHVLGIAKVFHRQFVTGTYFNRNHLAGLLELCLGLNIGWWLYALMTRRVKHLLWLSVCFVVLLSGLLRTGSRAGVSGLAVSCIFGAVLLCRKDRWFLGPVVGLLGLGVLGGWAGAGGDLGYRFSQITEGAGAWGGRWQVWRDTFAIIRDHPWFGTGLGNFEWVFPGYQSEDLAMGWVHAHNDYLELAAGLGLPAFGILCASWLGLGIFLVRSFFRIPLSRACLVLGGLISLAALSLHGLADFNLAVPSNALIFVLTAALTLRWADACSGSNGGLDR